MLDLLSSPFLGLAFRYMVVACGLVMVLRVAGFLDLATAVLPTTAAYVCLYLAGPCGVPLFVAAFVAAIAAGAMALGIDRTVYFLLRNRRATPTSMLLASLGVYVAFVAGLSLLAGSERRALPLPFPFGGIRIAGTLLLPIDLAAAGVVVFCAVVAFTMRHHRLSVAIRAIDDDPSLAAAAGLPLMTMRGIGYSVGGLILGIAGILFAVDIDVTPNMGLQAILVPAVAVVAALRFGAAAVVVCAFLVGVIQQVAAFWIGAQWSDPIVFAVMVLVLTATEGLRRLRQ